MTPKGIARTLAILLAFVGQYAIAQTLHFVSIADSNDATIGQGAAANAKALNSYFSAVAARLNLKPDFKLIDGADFSCKSISQRIKDLVPSQNDVVVVYYSGHGFREKTSPTKFPSFYCGQEPPYPSVSQIADDLGRTPARLVIVVADTCNVLISLPIPSIQLRAAEAAAGDAQLRSLFLEYKGVLTLSGSRPGQYSWYLPNGGLFTSQLLTALDQSTKPGHSGQWTDVITQATKSIIIFTADGARVVQNPQFDSSRLRHL